MSSVLSSDFVERKPELLVFRDLCSDPGKQVLFIHGPGGIGKTVLIQQMLSSAKNNITPSPLVLKELIDFNSTNYRHVDGLQSRIAEQVEQAVGEATFSDYRARPTSECFRRCLLKTCNERSVVLGLDTFERIQSDVTGEWVLSSDNEGLIVPGLCCIIGSREAPATENGAIRRLPLEGFSLDQTTQLYVKMQKSEGGPQIDAFLTESIQGLNGKAKGHPLLLRVAFEWLGANRWTREAIDHLSQTEFEAGIMVRMHELGEHGDLYYYDDNWCGYRVLSVVEYQALVMMSYLDRRFNSDLLYHLCESGYLRGAPVDDLLPKLGRPFFVKTIGDQEFQLHDEMARLMQQHIQPRWNELTGSKGQKLAADIVEWYDELIERAESLLDKHVLQAERLDYVFRYDLQAGKRLLEEYSNLRSDHLDKLLPSEARKYVAKYSSLDQFKIFECMAEMESRSQHYEQSARYWRSALGLAKRQANTQWQIESLIGLHNCTLQRDPKACLSYLQEALALCQGETLDQKRRVQYELGFAHRKLQDIPQAIKWYLEALEGARSTNDKVLQGMILNDLGYAYTFRGEYEKAITDVKGAEQIRYRCLKDLDRKMVDQRMASCQAPGSVAQAEQRQHLVNLERNRAEAYLEYGMTLNTVGEISRFLSRLLDAEHYYSQALAVFEELNDERWQVKALLGRGEAERRLASDKLSGSHLASRENYWKAAQADLDRALFLCEKHRIDVERHTAHRRMGRLLHDLALLQKGQDSEDALRYLQESLAHFERGLEFALKDRDVLEELENCTEIAFITDDLVRLQHRGQAAVTKQQEYADRLDSALKRHHEDDPRIYSYAVFENLLEMEKGALALVAGNYAEAMERYVRAFCGLASDLGYGSARYRMHYAHLIETIEGLPTFALQEEWCNAFLEAWHYSRVQGDAHGRVLAEAHPDLSEWCRVHLLTLT